MISSWEFENGLLEVANGKQYLGLQQAWFLKNALDHKLGLIIFQID